MTSQHRIFLDLQDILMIRLTCRQCGTAISAAPQEVKIIDERCPNCDTPWFVTGSTDRKQLGQLVATLAALRQRGEQAPCHIQLEVEKPA